MDISRRGYCRDHGPTTIVRPFELRDDEKYPSQNNVRWEENRKMVLIKTGPVSDPYGRSRHEWTVSLTLSDVAALFVVIARSVSADNAAIFRDWFGKHWQHIVRLAVLRCGVRTDTDE